MSDYSAIRTNLFDGLRRHNVITLLRLVSSLDVRSVEYVRHRYEEYATEFDATVDCLSQIGLIRDASDRLVPATSVGEHSHSDVSHSRAVLVAIATHHRVRPMLHDYLRTFHVTNGRMSQRASERRKSDDFSARDFLMDFDVLTFDRGKDEYVLAPDLFQLYADAHRHGNRLPPNKLEGLLDKRGEIGLLAELAVVQHERSRVGTGYADRVKHTAATDTAAGYDIESVTLVEHSFVPRCIEVKAVSESNCRFYWTANEIRMAKALREYYFLYLLPVADDGKVCIDQLRAICDPCDKVLCQNGEWTVEESVLRCQLRSPSKGES